LFGKLSASPVVIVIKGEPASKANSRKFVLIHGQPRLIKSSKALAYVKLFNAQCPTYTELLTGDVRVDITIWYASRRPDLDESLILDLLQGRVYENDRQVKERHVFWRLDRDNPRSEIQVTPLAPDGDPPGGSRLRQRKRAGTQRGQAVDDNP
jgi:Holliday junction resolvase RusA-like endonuclease